MGRKAVRVGLELGAITRFKLNGRGVADMASTPMMQGHLVGVAQKIADRLNATQDGTYDVGPIGEPVYSVSHPYPIGAHAFVRTKDQVARIEQASFNTLGGAV